MFDLKVYLPYLLYRAGSLVASWATADLRQLDISLPMWRVLAALHHEDGQRVGRLAELTSIEVSTLSRVIGSMQKKGLVTRQREADGRPNGDQRAVTVRLTRKGRATAEKFIPTARRYEDVSLRGFTQTEIRQFKNYLARVYENLERRE